MIQTRLPRSLKYQRIIPKGFPSMYKEWVIDPLTSNKYWVKNDIVRFSMMNGSNGVYDPFRSYIEITVSCSQKDMPVGLLQVDNSAQSFIQQMVVYSQDRQIQRRTQYGVISCFRNDMGLHQIISQGRQYQGLGYGSFDTMPYSKPISATFSQSRQASNGNQVHVWGPGTIFPTIPNRYVFNDDTGQPPLAATMQFCKGHVTTSNLLLSTQQFNKGTNHAQYMWQLLWSLWGSYNNIRTQYLTSFQSNKFIQATWSIPCYQLNLDSNVFLQGGYKKAVSGQNVGYSNVQNQKGEIVYKTTVRSQIGDKFYFNDHQSPDKINHQITTSNFGFANIFSPQYTRGLFQPFISPTVPQNMVYQGQFLKTKYPCSRKTFRIPLLSSVIGCDINQSQYMLLPLQAVKTVLIQLTLDPYAMFTSGYKDISQTDGYGMGFQQKRNYVIDRMRYKVQTYHFVANQVESYIKNSLVKQITMVTDFWALANQFQIPGSQGPNNTYIVGSTSKNLNKIVCLFYSNLYQKYSYCRKHWRNSNNITKFYCKIGVQNWPPQPYTGNGGNVMSDQYQDDNSTFLSNLYWSYDNMFYFNQPIPRINPYNFAINQRPYNPQNKATFYDPKMKDQVSYAFTQNSVNADTAMGMSWLHQNRAVGKAAYLLSFTPFYKDQNIIRGIDVSKQAVLQVVFESNNKNPCKEDQTLYILTQSSVFVKFTQRGIQTFGR